MLNVFITGHTSGLGRELATRFKNRGHNVFGFSRSNTFDLSTQNNIVRLASIWNDIDQSIFINNAHVHYCQTTLAYQWFSYFADSITSTMISIGSETTERVKNFIHPYAIQKHALDECMKQLQYTSHKCKLIHARFGYIDTPRVANISAPKLSVEEAASAVMWAFDNQKVRELLITP